jgi:NAD(P)H-hydrate repair Nnr-like enzyme with NAD(P)H-hydrate dehydratase domain
MGVFIHGEAGDYYILENAKESLIASDILENIGRAFAELAPI